jgi:hypothetical protein
MCRGGGMTKDNPDLRRPGRPCSSCRASQTARSRTCRCTGGNCVRRAHIAGKGGRATGERHWSRWCPTWRDPLAFRSFVLTDASNGGRRRQPSRNFLPCSPTREHRMPGRWPAPVRGGMRTSWAVMVASTTRPSGGGAMRRCGRRRLTLSAVQPATTSAGAGQVPGNASYRRRRSS